VKLITCEDGFATAVEMVGVREVPPTRGACMAHNSYFATQRRDSERPSPFEIPVEIGEPIPGNKPASGDREGIDGGEGGRAILRPP